MTDVLEDKPAAGLLRASHGELQAARRLTDSLFDLISRETLYERPISDRHRLIFYVGHLEAFDWNQLARGVIGMPSFDAAFDVLFEAGIDPPPGQALQDTATDWPTYKAVCEYNVRARGAVDRIWHRIPPDRRHTVLEHRWMHAETICYLLHQLRPELKRAPLRREAVSCTRPPGNAFLRIAAGAATLGQTAGHFGWDNEFPQHEVFVPEFEILRYKVSNRDYLRYVDAGGEAPPFWCRRDDAWWLRRMCDIVPLSPDAPVYATHRQAHAYAQWAGAALPSEAQWHRAAFGDSERAYPWGDRAPGATLGNFDFVAWDPVPVTADPAGDSAAGVSQMIGNGWEWTATPFAGFDGFQPRSYYPGYSANFFDGEHFVLKGASPVTPRALLRRSFRNWFRADYPYVYSTIRLVRR